jgi:phosphate acetyltransferase
MSDRAQPALVDRWFQQARHAPARIVLADGGDERAAEAAERLNRDGLARATVVDDPARLVSEAVKARATSLDHEVDLDDPLQVAVLAVACGEMDGCVAGATRPTGEVIRAGLRLLGTTEAGLVSSSFVLVLGDGRPVTYGDCGVLPDPDPAQLAAIAVASAATHEQLVGEQARVAMLSFSTKGSAKHPNVDKVREATELARAAAPDLVIDGELQFDAAFVPAVGESKAPGSPVAGRANVFIFPDLASGNIAYKITERVAGANAFGPLLQGMGGVLHDLSRGCSADDIVTVAVIAGLQARAAGSAG